MKRLTHIGANGEARMVDVSAKPVQLREAVASGEIRLQKGTIELIGFTSKFVYTVSNDPPPEKEKK